MLSFWCFPVAYLYWSTISKQSIIFRSNPMALIRKTAIILSMLLLAVYHLTFLYPLKRKYRSKPTSRCVLGSRQSSAHHFPSYCAPPLRDRLADGLLQSLFPRPWDVLRSRTHRNIPVSIGCRHPFSSCRRFHACSCILPVCYRMPEYDARAHLQGHCSLASFHHRMA